MIDTARIDRTIEIVADALESGRPLDALAPIIDTLHGACAAGEHESVARLAALAGRARRESCALALGVGFSIAVGDRAMLVDPMPGCLLIQPPMVGVEARAVRERVEGAKLPAIVLAREPLMRDGRWPVVASGGGLNWPDERRGPPGGLTVRARVDPPVDVTRVDSSPTKDEAPTPEPAWFAEAIAALDEAALTRIDEAAPAAHRARTIVELIEAHPTGTALYEALEAASMAALEEGDPGPRVVKPSTSF